VDIGNRGAFEDFLHRRRERMGAGLIERGYLCETPPGGDAAVELVGRVDRRPQSDPVDASPGWTPVRGGARSVIAPRRADNATRQESADVGRETRQRLYPPEREELVGREEDLAPLVAAIDLEHFPIQLYGGPGTGKSALLAELVAPRASTSFWIDLRTSGLDTATAVTRLLARALSLRRSAGERSGTLGRDLRETLAEQPDHLVILDNVEPAAHTALVAGLLSVTGRLVICAREAFAIPGHREALHHRLDRLREGQGERLWVRAGGPPGDPGVLRAICHECLADHPYAIALSAAAARSLRERNGTHDWTELEERLWVCQLRARGVDGDHHELRTAFHYSLSTLPELARRLLAELTVCAPSGVGREWLTAQTSVAGDDVEHALRELVGRRLVRARQDDRYTWHPMLLEHAGLLHQGTG
jgi:hypothetical protein